MLLAVILALVVLIPILLVLGNNMWKKRVAARVRNEHGEPVPCAPLTSFIVDRIIKVPALTRAMDNLQKYGRVHMTTFLMQPSLLIAEPELAKQFFLHSKIEKVTLKMTRFVEWFVGYSVSRANGADWKRMRHVMDPAFVDLRKYLPIFVSKSQYCMDKMQQETSTNGLVSIYDKMQRMALDILGMSIFGYDFEYLDNPNNRYLHAYNDTWEKMINIPYLLFPWLCHLPTAYCKRMEQNLQTLDQLCFDLIDKSMKRNNEAATSMLDMMVEATSRNEQGLSAKELRDNMMVFFIAGHETSSTSLTIVLNLLAKHQDVQEKLVQKINSMENPLHYESLQSNDYLNAVIKETLRLYPPAPIIPPRRAVETIQLGNYTVEKDTYVQVNLYALHRDERYWVKPLEFRPERWLIAEEIKMRHSHSYVPFGGGARVCIGNNFSLMEQRAFLTMFLRKFKVDLPYAGYEMEIDIDRAVLSPKRDAQLKISLR